MPPVLRTRILEALPEPFPDGGALARLSEADAHRLRPLTAEPLYAIPEGLLDLLAGRIPGWLAPVELERERRLSRLCRAFGAVAVFYGRPVSHLLFGRPAPPVIDDDSFREMGWDRFLSGSAAVRQSLARAGELSEPVFERLEAYLGWLMTCPTFLAERDALRARWRDAVDALGFIPPLASGRDLSVLAPRATAAADAPDAPDGLAAELAAFYDRWQLMALTTWDLPQPRGANIGGPAVAGALAGVADSPAVQLPPTLRLPARYPLRNVLSGRPAAHLAEWEAVLEQRHPSRFNHVRWRRVLHLHFLRNVVLAGGYRDRFRRRAGPLDEVFAAYFGESDAEGTRKLRLWVDRHLRPAPPAAAPAAAG